MEDGPSQLVVSRNGSSSSHDFEILEHLRGYTMST